LAAQGGSTSAPGDDKGSEFTSNDEKSPIALRGGSAVAVATLLVQSVPGQFEFSSSFVFENHSHVQVSARKKWALSLSSLCLQNILLYNFFLGASITLE